jgi:DNA-binding response OmpR family regulator
MRLSLIEDDLEQRDHLMELLRAAGHTVDAVASGEEFQRHFLNDTFDVVLIDWNLPGKSGLTLLKWIRNEQQSNVPAMMVTVRSAADDIVAAFHAGVDDFLSKPIDETILLARISALCRRSYSNYEPASIVSFGKYEFDVPHERARIDLREIALTHKEFHLALALFSNLGRPLSRRYLLDHVWQRDLDHATRTLDAHISALRTKLGLTPESGFSLVPIYSYGYRLDTIHREVRGA